MTSFRRTTNSAAPDQYMDDALIFNAEELEYLEKGYWVDWQDLLLEVVPAEKNVQVRLPEFKNLLKGKPETKF